MSPKDVLSRSFQALTYYREMSPRPAWEALSFVRYVWRRFNEDRCSQVAASLTFTTLLALVPLVTIAVALLSAFPVFTPLSAQLKTFLLTHMAPEAAGKIITVYMPQFSANAAKLTAAGIVFLGVTAMFLMLTIDRALNAIWRVVRPRPLLQRLVVYWAVLTLGPLLIGASLSLTSWLVSVSLGVARQVPGGGLILLRTAPLLLTTVAFALMFSVVPNRPVPLGHAVAGGLAAAVMFELMKRGFAYYVSNFPTYTLVYGAFAAIPIFLVWIYLSWLAVLLGAVIAAALSNWHGGAWKRPGTPGDSFMTGLRVLRALAQQMRTGETLGFHALRRRLHVSAEALEQVLEQMARAGWVRPLLGGAWVLVRDPAQLRVAEVCRWLLIDVSRQRHAAADDPGLQAILRRLEACVEAELDLPVDESPALASPEPASRDRPERPVAAHYR